MTHRWPLVALLGAALLGCEQASQELPLEPESGTSTTRTLGTAGGTISTPAGLSIAFPQGSLASSTTITLVGLEGGLDLPVTFDGEPVPGTAFEVRPLGMVLGTPARMSLRVPRSTLESVNPRTLTGLLLTDDGPVYLSRASLDLGEGILKTDLPRLGEVALRVSDDVIEVGAGLAAVRGDRGLAAAPPAPLSATPGPVDAGVAPAGVRTSDLVMSCGATGEPACQSTAAIDVDLSPDLDAALNSCVTFIDPEVTVELNLRETDAGATEASGSFRFTGTVRYQTGSDGAACSSGAGSVHSLDVDETFDLGSGADAWTAFTYDPSARAITFDDTSAGTRTLNCDCGADIFAASEIFVGQTSEEVAFEGLTGQVTWSLRLRR